MPESLAVRRAGMSTAITRVHEVLESFAARDHNGEILTACAISRARGPVGGLPSLGAR